MPFPPRSDNVASFVRSSSVREDGRRESLSQEMGDDDDNAASAELRNAIHWRPQRTPSSSGVRYIQPASHARVSVEYISSSRPRAR